MRIIYISSSTVPSRTANSIHVMKMCQAFKQIGQDIVLLAPRRSTELSNIDIWEHYGIREQFPILHLKANKLFKEYDYAIEAGSYAKRTCPELAFSRNIPAAAITAQLGITTICEAHEPPKRFPKSPLIHLSYRLLLKGRGFHRLVVITTHLKKYLTVLLNRYMTEDKFLLLPDGVDLERFQGSPKDAQAARKKLGFPVDQLTIGYAGHLYPGRGIELILELANRFREHNFIIIGGNDDAITKHSQIVQEKGLRNVSLQGFVPNTKLPVFLSACDLLIMPYQRKVEASGGGDISAWMSPMKMFEYMASNRLILASNLPVLREVLNEKNAVLCEPENVDMWSYAIEKAAKNRIWRETIANQAFLDVQSFSWQNRARQIISSLQMY